VNHQSLTWLGGIAAALIVAAGIGVAGSFTGERIGGIPAFAICGLIAFAVQWIVFVPAYLRQTEHYFDLTGSVTYIVLAWVGWSVGGDGRAWLLAGLVTVWAVRLGSFLFGRVREAGGDRRFDAIKPDFMQFLMTWTLQGLWVFLTLSPALAAMTSTDGRPLGPVAAIGSLFWLAGFAFEVTADAQKRRFRAEAANRDRFITTGLWSWSQHPNYFGEIVLWCGIAIIAAPVLSGWQWATMISPVFVWLLLTRISGIRMLDARARRRWGDDAAYQSYRARTPRLVPRPPAWGSAAMGGGRDKG
jgi:steroid 5-alpha reductase family enzyme